MKNFCHKRVRVRANGVGDVVKKGAKAAADQADAAAALFGNKRTLDVDTSKHLDNLECKDSEGLFYAQEKKKAAHTKTNKAYSNLRFEKRSMRRKR